MAKHGLYALIAGFLIVLGAPTLIGVVCSASVADSASSHASYFCESGERLSVENSSAFDGLTQTELIDLIEAANSVTPSLFALGFERHHQTHTNPAYSLQPRPPQPLFNA